MIRKIIDKMEGTYIPPTLQTPPIILLLIHYTIPAQKKSEIDLEPGLHSGLFRYNMIYT